MEGGVPRVRVTVGWGWAGPPVGVEVRVDWRPAPAGPTGGGRHDGHWPLGIPNAHAHYSFRLRLVGRAISKAR